MNLRLPRRRTFLDRALQCVSWLWWAAFLSVSSGVGSAQTTPGPTAGAVTNAPPEENSFSRYLSPYEPIYFLLGTYPAAEFQFSLKYQVCALTNGWARLTTNVFLAYTQTSFWDLLSSDPSFYDTSYKPSAFYRLTDILSDLEEKPLPLDLQAGLEHESNGRGGSAERSMYRAYFQPTLTLGPAQGLQLSLTPRAWMYFIDLSPNNPDMANYKGYASLQSTLSWNRQNLSQDYQLTTAYGLGDDGSHASLKFDLSVSVMRWHWTKWFTPRIHVQYFTGYGQTLRQYNQSSHGLRVGISLYD